MKAKIAELEAQLRATKSVALSAIAAMESAAAQFATIASANNPGGDGLRFVCVSSAQHIGKLAQEYTARLEAK